MLDTPVSGDRTLLPALWPAAGRTVGRWHLCQHYERGLYAVDLLTRHRATKSQGGLSRQARKRNLTGAFIPSPTAAQTLRGHPVLLVDDVMTTGATLQAATSCLRRAGAGEIRALTIARVI